MDRPAPAAPCAETAETRNMSGFRRPRPADRAIARVAEGRQAVVTHAHLLALGLDQDAIDYRVRVGRLHPRYRGVYVVGHRLLTDEGEFRAAVDAIGEGAAIASVSALALWGIRERRVGEPIHVAVPRKVASRPGLRVHSLAALPTPELSLRAGIPVLTPAPALLGAASHLPRRELRRAVNEALVLKRVSVPSLVEALVRGRGRRGRGRLATVVASARPTRSELEDAAVAFLNAHGLGPYATNVRLPAGEVDILFAAHGLAIELDGAEFHDNPIARAIDAEKQARLEAAGLTVVRLRWRDLTDGSFPPALAPLLSDRDRGKPE